MEMSSAQMNSIERCSVNNLDHPLEYGTWHVQHDTLTLKMGSIIRIQNEYMENDHHIVIHR